eukprot:jgi/Undpi1/11766/HiC_scaffold_37.g14061.m1
MRHSLLALALASALPAQGDVLLTISPFDDQLRSVDPVSGATQSSVTVNLNGSPIVGGNGLARDPISGTLFGVVEDGNFAGRILITIDPATGIATQIGNTNEQISALAFDPSGALFGVTGDGGNAPEALWAIDPTNASMTLVTGLGNGSDGEAFTIDGNGVGFHASGYGTQNVDEIFESVDLGTNAVAPITWNGYDFQELTGLCVLTGDSFLACDLNDELLLITNRGDVKQLAQLDHTARGLVFEPSPSSQPYFRFYGEGCPSITGFSPLLAGTGTPAIGGSFTLEIRCGEANRFGIIAWGTSNISVPILTNCSLQIAPTIPDTFSFVTDAAGSASRPFNVPAFLAPGPLYAQAGLFESTGPVFTNPLEVNLR